MNFSLRQNFGQANTLWLSMSDLSVRQDVPVRRVLSDVSNYLRDKCNTDLPSGYLNFQFPARVAISSHYSLLHLFASAVLEDDLGPFLDDRKILQLQLTTTSRLFPSCD